MLDEASRVLPEPPSPASRRAVAGCIIHALRRREPSAGDGVLREREEGDARQRTDCGTKKERPLLREHPRADDRDRQRRDRPRRDDGADREPAEDRMTARPLARRAEAAIERDRDAERG